MNIDERKEEKKKSNADRLLSISVRGEMKLWPLSERFWTPLYQCRLNQSNRLNS